MLQSLSLECYFFLILIVLLYSVFFVWANKKYFLFYLANKQKALVVMLSLLVLTVLRLKSFFIYMFSVFSLSLAAFVVTKAYSIKLDYEQYVPLALIYLVWTSFLLNQDWFFSLMVFASLKFIIDGIETPAFDHHWSSDRDCIVFNRVYWITVVSTPLTIIILDYYYELYLVTEYIFYFSLFMIVARLVLSAHILLCRNPVESKMATAKALLAGVSVGAVVTVGLSVESLVHSGNHEKSLVTQCYRSILMGEDAYDSNEQRLHVERLRAIDKNNTYLTALQQFKETNKHGFVGYSVGYKSTAVQDHSKSILI